MNLKIMNINNVPVPAEGYGYMFIDAADNKLKIKKTNSIIEYSNTLDDIQLLDLTDYSSFEVFAHDYNIPVGECEELGGYVNYSIPASVTNKFMLRIVGDIETNDIVIDWGDGTTSTISKHEYEDIIDYPTDTYKRKDLLISHTYDVSNYPLASDSSKHSHKFIVKIFGKKYCAFRHHISKFKNPETNAAYSNVDGKFNLVCRVFDIDLPVASFINDFSSTFYGSQRLLNVVVDLNNNIKKVNGATSLFSDCKNLLKVEGLEFLSNSRIVYASMFYRCYSLMECDLLITNPNEGIQGLFYDCRNLTLDLYQLLSRLNVSGNLSINVLHCFNKCIKFTCSNYEKLGDLLWNNKNITWLNTTETFIGCSTELRSHIPASWGGTASDDIIEKSLEEKYNDLLTRIETLENK